MQGKLSRAAQMLLGFTALLGAVEPAFAAGNTIKLGSADVWTVYAFGNAQAVADAFRALTNFSASGTFQSIVGLIALMGVLGVGASGGFNPSQARKLIGYFVGVFLVTYILFGVGNGGPLVVNLEVIDTVDMTWKAPVTVPAVVGIPASIISTAGYRITQSIEASFALPDELKMSKGAPFNLAASMIADASQARISDPNLASSLAYYVQDCFTIGVARGTLAADSLINSTDFLNDIRYDSPSVMVNTMLQPPAGTPGVVTCGEAWTLINNAIAAQGGGATDFLKDASAWTKTPAMTVVNAAADRTAQWASNGGVTDGGSMVKQAAVLSAFRGAYSQAASQTGNSEFLTGLALTQATESQRSSWITGAEVFNKTMGYVFAILQVFVYAITPLVLCACLVPGLGLALLKNFSQILLWLAIWQPMLAIVNFIIISMQQAELGGIMSMSGHYGFTLSNVGIVSEKTANLRAASTFVGTMVPALAWAMVKGSVDFSRVIGSAVGENFAQGAANTMTTGNYSLNQASMDSFTANKHSVASTGAWGSGHNTADGTASTEHNLGGDSMAAASREQLALNASSNLGTSKGSTGGSSAGTSTTGTTGDAAADTMTFSRAGTDSVASGHTAAAGKASGAHGTIGITGGAQIVKAGSGTKPDGSTAAGGPGAGQAGQNGAPSGSTPANVQSALGDALDRLSVNANLGASGTISLTQQEADNHSRNSAITESGTGSRSGARTTNGSQGANHGKTAGQTHGAQEGQNQTLTGINSAYSRAEVMTSYMHMDNFMTQGEWGRSTPASTPLGDKVQHLGQHDAIRTDVNAETAKNAKDERTYGAEADKIRKQAKTQSDKNRGEADAVIARETKDAYGGEAAANRKPGERIMTGIANEVRDLRDGAVNFAKNAINGVKPKDEGGNKDGDNKEGANKEANSTPAPAPTTAPNERVARIAAANAGGMMGTGTFNPMGARREPPHANADQPAQTDAAKHAAAEAGKHAPAEAGKHAPTEAGKHAPTEAAKHAPTDAGKHAQPDAGKHAQPDAGKHAPSQAGQQPGHPAGQQKPAQQAARQERQDHPEQQSGRPDQQARNGQPAPAGQAEKQAQNSVAARDAGQAEPGKPGHDKPQLAALSNKDQDHQKPGDRQREQDPREQQDRQLVAAAPVGQPHQAPQMPSEPQPPQVAQPVVPGADQHAQQLAAAQQQPAQAIPNPFSGEKSGESSGQMQGQVQMAEQRAERVSNQLRGVDGMLASAEGRKASELPDLINQARELVRKA